MGTKKIRTRFFIAAEGESERSFIAWMQRLSESHLNVHLDSVLLGGGGYEKMLKTAIKQRLRRSQKGAYQACFLLVDQDRSEQGDWPVKQLREEARRKNFEVILQKPNHEGLLLRLLPEMENENPNRISVKEKLKSKWPEYEKPMNANSLERKFSIDDLRRVASKDPELHRLLTSIGFLPS